MMNRKVVNVVLLLGLAAIASAQMSITGYLYTEIEPVQVDSTYFEYGGTQRWFPTPGWNANPGETATFDFPDFPDWPAIIEIAGMITGMPFLQRLVRPAQDSWYQFDPPFEQVKVKFHGEVGIQENSNRTFSLSVPNILTNQALENFAQNNNVEILNPCGQVVHFFPVSPGVYFCRFIDKPDAWQRFTLLK